MPRYTVKSIRRNEVLHITGHVNLYFPGTGPLHCIFDNETDALLLDRAFRQKATAEKEADFLNKKDAGEVADRAVYTVRGDKEFRIVKQLTGEFFGVDLSAFHYVLTGSRIIRVTEFTKGGLIIGEPVKADGSHGGDKVYLNIHQEPVYLFHTRYRESE